MLRTRAFLAVQLALLTMAAPALAAEAQTAPPNSDADPAAATATASGKQEVQVVTITATKRRQSVQEVPASVSAVSADTLADRNLSSAADMQQVMPSVSFVDTGAGNLASLSVRGVGTQNYSDAVEASVGMAVDGVPLARTFQGLGAMYDLERVEVLRGPQGTLFGKNSTGGVMSVVTRDPDQDFGGEASVGTGTYGLRKENLALNLPLAKDVLSMRLAAMHQERDGYLRNLATGHMLGADRQSGVRLKALLTPAAGRRILVSADYQEQAGTADAAAAVVPQYPGQDVRNLGQNTIGSIAGPDNVLIDTSKEPINRGRSSGASVQWDETLGGYTLTSISAYRTGYSFDAVGGSVPNDPMQKNDNAINLHQASEELRLTSPTTGPLDYVAGLFAYRQAILSDLDQIADLWALSKAVPVQNLVYGRVLAHADTRTSNYAIFGQANYKLSSRLTVLAGARWSHENTSVLSVNGPLGSYTLPNGTVRNYTSVLRPVGAASDSAVTQRPSWQTGARYQFTHEAMAYATLSRSFKGTAFNTASTSGSLERVEPEIATSLETGFKSRLADNRVKLNLTAYLTDYNNFQSAANIVPQGGGLPLLVLVNAGKLRSKGIEWDTEALLTDSLRLGFNGAWIDATYLSFPKGPCYYSLIASGSCPTGSRELAGGKLQGTPKLSYNLSLQQNLELPSSVPFDADVRLDYGWRDSVQWAVSQDPASVSPSYGMLGLMVALRDRRDHWSLSFYGKNLNNAFHSRLQTWPLWGPAVRQYVPVDYRRVVGLNLGYRF